MAQPEKKLSFAQIIILSFVGLILCGALLLCLPFATKDGAGATFADALFTATSAVCVTGLVVHDTATYWSSFGQVVILLLIQLGGMGLATMAAAISLASGKRITLRQRSTMQEAIAAPSVGGIVRVTGFILRATAIIELCGALLLLPAFARDFGFLRGLWYSVFHSVSAFCNAGFDLMGSTSPYSSLTGYIDNPLVNITIMSLIVVGGLGFLTWYDLRTHKLHLRRCRMQTKVILTVTPLLILLPAGYLFFFEFAHLPLGERLLASFFQSVTTRTAGFNTADLTVVSETGCMLMILLMLVGGSPGSTAGGMKTTTLAVMISSAASVFRRRPAAQMYGRRVEADAVSSAATLVTLYIGLSLSGAMIIARVESIPLVTALFETASALGTVGLTLGITPQLGAVSRLILIALMYLGRVGSLTLVFATLSAAHTGASNLPKERITVG